MLREKFKWRSHENESTDARHRGGSSCSSDEVFVMEMERRGWVSLKKDSANQKLGGANFFLRRLEAERFQEKGWQEPCESRGSRTVLRGTGGEIPPVYPTRRFENCKETCEQICHRVFNCCDHIFRLAYSGIQQILSLLDCFVGGYYLKKSLTSLWLVFARIKKRVTHDEPPLPKELNSVPASTL